MGRERINYKNFSYEENNIIICRVQAFYYKLLSGMEHPAWFREGILRDVIGNSWLPEGKYFFDEDELEGYPDRQAYTIRMSDIVITGMKSINFYQFMSFIEKEIDNFFYSYSDYSERLHYGSDTDGKLTGAMYQRYINLMEAVTKMLIDSNKI